MQSRIRSRCCLSDDSLRVFLACRLGDDAAARAHGALQPLRDALVAEKLRWVPPRNYHVTLRFFGAQSTETVADVCRLVASIAAVPRRAFRCRAASLLALPNWSRPAVLTLTVDSDGSLEQLASACEALIAPRFGPADHPFRAHLTVARCRRARRLPPLVLPAAFEFELASCGVYRSTLSARGPRYDAVCEFDFAGAN